MPQDVNALLNFESKAHSALQDKWNHMLQSCSLSTFTYLQFFEDGSFTNLCSDQEWSKKYYSLEKIDPHFCAQINQARHTEGYHVYFWPQDPNKGEVTSWLLDHGIGTGFTVFKQSGGKVYGWGFTSNVECTDLMNLYLTNKEAFLKFGRQFAMDYEKFALHHSLIPRANMGIEFQEKGLIHPQEVRDNLSDQISKVLIFTPNGPEIISRRLWDVIELLAAGQSAKQIAFNLNIAVKTVEERIANLRSTLGLYSRDKIVKLWKMNCGV